MRTTLTGEGNQKIIIDYLEEHASDSLVEKINRCGKTMKECWDYITSQAKKRAKNGCAMIEDAEVFGWAVHFFEEEGNVKIEKTVTRSKDLPVKKTEPKKEEPKKVEHKKEEKKPDMLPGQLTIAELFGGIG